ncbi:MAG: cell division protein CrgA [Nocardioides sp.]
MRAHQTSRSRAVSKSTTRKSSDEAAYADPSSGPLLSVRFIVAVLLIALGIAWIAYYYLVVRPDPTVLDAKAGGPAIFDTLRDWKGMNWNYIGGFLAIFVGLLISAHKSTPLGRGRGVVTGMLFCFLFGLLWICTFYVIAEDPKIPVMNDLHNYNLVVGIAFMAVGFGFATKWE